MKTKIGNKSKYTGMNPEYCKLFTDSGQLPAQRSESIGCKICAKKLHD